MQGTVDGFSYGLVTPVAAFLMAALGGALGLRCTVRSLHGGQTFKAGWLALGAAAIGCGVWTMHFVGMMGFSVAESAISYDVPLTLAIVVVGIGVFIVGYRGTRPAALATAGLVTGLGVAAMHYIGMYSMSLRGEFAYDPVLVVLSVLIAVFAATAALWAAMTVRGFLPSLGASAIMGVAVTGMHYTGMSAMTVHLDGHASRMVQGGSMTTVLLPMLFGPLVLLLVAGVIVMFDPLLISGEDTWDGTREPRGGRRPRGRHTAPAPAPVAARRTLAEDDFWPQPAPAPAAPAAPAAEPASRYPDSYGPR
ncbi:MHYT domain-containing protein [Streptomyces albidoflavus]|uniref:MHYT domain-containing protein n=1 Tax=Streptomyces albidoflavus TaxID=1886 RepID=UPI0033BF95AC